MSSGGNTHWCYQCRQPIRSQTRATVCPYCDGGFVQELDELTGCPVGINSSYGLREGPDQLFGIMEALDSLMIRSNREQRLGLIEALDTFMGQRRRHGINNDRNSPWLIFQGKMPRRTPVHGNGGFEMFFNGHTGMQCRQSRSLEHVLRPIHIVRFVKINLCWALKQGKCLATTYIIMIVLSRGWSSIIRALFVAMS